MARGQYTDIVFFMMSFSELGAHELVTHYAQSKSYRNSQSGKTHLPEIQRCFK